jgi:hypothetical protein
MGDNPFSNTPFAAIGGQLAAAWQAGLETWWKALLADRGRLTELAKHLAEAGLVTMGSSDTSADDLAKVLEALELTTERMDKLQGRVDGLADTVEAMVGYLEKKSGGTP